MEVEDAFKRRRPRCEVTRFLVFRGRLNAGVFQPGPVASRLQALPTELSDRLVGLRVYNGTL